MFTWKHKKGRHAVIIENKLNYASDQVNQLNDYYVGVEREGFNVEKVVYMHIDSYKSAKHTDTRKEVLQLTVDFNARMLIDTLEKMNTTSYFVEYSNLLKENITNYKGMVNSKKIQAALNSNELEELIAISKLVGSENWYKAIYQKIIDDLEAGDVGVDLIASCKASYATFYYKEYKVWVELWFYPLEFNLYICSHNPEITMDDFCLSEKYKERYFFKNKDKFSYKYPSELGKLITDLGSLLKVIR